MSDDKIYSMPLGKVGDFTFDQQVVDVFPDMISRSVPGYGSILSMIAELAESYASPGSNIYDLGCSLGAATRLIRPRVPADCVIHAVDSSPAMIQRLRADLSDEASGDSSDHGLCEVCVCEGDLSEAPMQNASFVVLNFTLQFVPADRRQNVIQRICDSMLPGGALVLSEKICFTDEAEQNAMTHLHHEFKRANGYSELEISQKRTALENTMIPETLSVHRARLHAAGFGTVAKWFQCFNFASMLAIK